MQETVVSYLPDSFTFKQREELFDEIVRLYDLADAALATLTLDGITNRSVQAELAIPFITQVTNSANILSAFYSDIAHQKKPITPDLQDTMEEAFRTILFALRDFVAGAEEKLLPLEGI